MYSKPSIWQKIKSGFGIPRYPITNYKPPKAKHDPVRLAEIKQRIVIAVNHNLSKNDFQQVRKNLELWVRKRTDDIYDVISLQFDSHPSLGCIRVLVNIGYHSSKVEKLFCKLADESYDLTTSTDGGYCYQVNPDETKTEWMFWNIAFEESEKDDLIYHINTFGISFLEKVSSHKELLAFIERRKGPFHIQRAILYQLLGNREKSLEILKSSKQHEIEKHSGRLDEIKKTPLWIIREKLLDEI